MTTARRILGGAVSAPNTAGLGFGGYAPGSTAATEEFNVSTNVNIPAVWSLGGALVSLRGGTNRGGAGTKNAALLFGGRPNPSTYSGATESYDGTTWTEVNDLNTGRSGAAGFGTQTSAIAASGGTAPVAAGDTDVEEWNGSSWTTLTPMNLNHADGHGGGIETAGFVIAGSNGAPNNATIEEYNGSTWTTSPGTMSTGRKQLAAAGTLTAAVGFAGYVPGSGFTNATEEYDGSSFSTGGNLLIAKRNLGGCGVLTAALAIGGQDPGSPNSVTVEQYNGTNWATAPTLVTANNQVSATGTTSDAIGSAGYVPQSQELTAETTALNVKTLTTS
jgi:hypothetical protein